MSARYPERSAELPVRSANDPNPQHLRAVQSGGHLQHFLVRGVCVFLLVVGSGMPLVGVAAGGSSVRGRWRSSSSRSAVKRSTDCCFGARRAAGRVGGSFDLIAREPASRRDARSTLRHPRASPFVPRHHAPGPGRVSSGGQGCPLRPPRDRTVLGPVPPHSVAKSAHVELQGLMVLALRSEQLVARTACGRPLCRRCNRRTGGTC